jgi:hypothetical protein
MCRGLALSLAASGDSTPTSRGRQASPPAAHRGRLPADGARRPDTRLRMRAPLRVAVSFRLHLRARSTHRRGDVMLAGQGERRRGDLHRRSSVLRPDFRATSTSTSASHSSRRSQEPRGRVSSDWSSAFAAARPAPAGCPYPAGRPSNVGCKRLLDAPDEIDVLWTDLVNGEVIAAGPDVHARAPLAKPGPGRGLGRAHRQPGRRGTRRPRRPRATRGGRLHSPRPRRH